MGSGNVSVFEVLLQSMFPFLSLILSIIILEALFKKWKSSRKYNYKNSNTTLSHEERNHRTSVR